MLEKLVKYCPRKDLDSFRLVCTRWNDASLAHFRSIVKLTFVHYHEQSTSFVVLLHPKRSNDSWGQTTSMQDFLQFVANPQNQCQTKPYRQIELRSWQFWNLFDARVISRQFWEQVGSHVTSLTLRECHFLTVEEFRKIHSLPSLSQA